ncbi:hypothetical protein CAPTEDRAFT_220746 [Capitella teleta]|uniref:Uncharacterized protein n=1 Tax=Capitella teleta TaxID=283909 RepID=R7U7A8_CAPTE|nr:hypothetical protein CAPTEDRAFT_220746 [Capitella teleta]|eukprot:ELU01854.1 hypothetical protein CAPTEDRAFT_220746 [Capitella teleta]
MDSGLTNAMDTKLTTVMDIEATTAADIEEPIVFLPECTKGPFGSVSEGTPFSFHGSELFGQITSITGYWHIWFTGGPKVVYLLHVKDLNAFQWCITFLRKCY